MNAMIHVLMYLYYGLASCGPKIQKYLWWKKYLTIIQMVGWFPGWLILKLNILIVGIIWLKIILLAMKEQWKHNMVQKHNSYSLFGAQVQFHVTIGHTALSLYVNCDFPHWMHYSLICYAITFIVLFGNFYYQTYRRQQPARRDVSSSSKAGKAVSNGTLNGLSKAANGAMLMGSKEEKPQENSGRRKRKGRAKRD